MSNIKTFINRNIKQFDISDIKALLCFVLNKNINFIITNDDYILSNTELTKLNRLLKKRKKGYSIGVLIGKKEFYGRDFIVDKNVLIPRPETEIMIDEVLKTIRHCEEQSDVAIQLKSGKVEKLKIIDIGTGTGCIPITLFHELKKLTLFSLLPFPFYLFASDISKPALKIARKNAKLHNAKIKFIHSDLFQNVSLFVIPDSIRNLSPFKNYKRFPPSREGQSFDIITANLPYVPTGDKNETIEKEPDLALYSGKDGLDHYRKLAKEIKNKGIQFKYLFMEIAPFQAQEIKKIFKDFGKIEIIKDLSGKNRIVKVETFAKNNI